jgi:hypothetical protein
LFPFLLIKALIALQNRQDHFLGLFADLNSAIQQGLGADSTVILYWCLRRTCGFGGLEGI